VGIKKCGIKPTTRQPFNKVGITTLSIPSIKVGIKKCGIKPHNPPTL
jgi:hypothetical protein